MAVFETVAYQPLINNFIQVSRTEDESGGQKRYKKLRLIIDYIRGSLQPGEASTGLNKTYDIVNMPHGH